MTITVWGKNSDLLAQIQAPFIWEWGGVADDDLAEEEHSAGGSAQELWETLNPYSWEDPEEFPNTPEQWQDYLTWAIGEIVKEFECRIERHCRELEPIARRHVKQNKRKPTIGWLLEHYPNAHDLNRETQQFRLRVVERVLEDMKDVPVQMQLF